MTTKVIDEEWCVLASLLPEGWRNLARETGAMKRARGSVDSPDVLLQLLFLHVATGLSLKQAAARATTQGLVSVSDVALMKRLRSSEEWLRELAKRMFESSRFAAKVSLAPEGRRVRAVDATTVEEPGATGTNWRVHYSIGLPEMRCDFYQLTDATGGETYTQLPVERGDIILGDRGYCHRKGVAHVLRDHGDVIVRFHSTSFPLLVPDPGSEKSLTVLPLLRDLEGCQPGEWAARFETDGERWPIRLCAVRKSVAAAEVAKEKILRAARKKQRKVQPQTLEFAEYVVVLATLENGLLNASEILELYRARWQIELCFKRFKSLLQLGHLPKRSDKSARAWIQGKLLTVLLIERLIQEADLFSPWGFDLHEAQSMARIH
jgi:hypothetical protein